MNACFDCAPLTGVVEPKKAVDITAFFRL